MSGPDPDHVWIATDTGMPPTAASTTSSLVPPALEPAKPVEPAAPATAATAPIAATPPPVASHEAESQKKFSKKY